MNLKKCSLLLLFAFIAISVSSQATFKERIKAINQIRSTHLDSALNLISQTRDLFSDSLSLCEYRTDFHRQVFFNYYFRNDYSQSANALLDSLLPAQKECYPPEDYRIALTYYNLGIVFNNLHAYPKAKKYYKACAQVLNQLNENSGRVASKYGAIGQFYINQNDFETGLYYLNKAELIYDENQDYGAKYIMFMQVKGNGERLLKQYDKSIKTLEKCLLKHNENTYNDPTHESRIYHDLSIAEFESNQLDKARVHIKKAIEVSTKKNLNSLLSLHYDFFANMLKAEKDYDLAFQYYAKSNSLFLDPENNASVEQISGSFENLADAYCAQGNFIKGLEVYQKGMQYLAPNLESDYFTNPKISNNPIISKTYLRRQLGLKANALFELGLKSNQQKAFLSAIDAIHKYDSLTVMLLNEDWREESHLNLIQVANEDYKFALLSAQILDKMQGGNEFSIKVFETLSKLKARLLSRGIIQKDIKAQNLNDSLMILDKQYLSEISFANTAVLKAEQLENKTKRDSLFDIYFEKVEAYNEFKTGSISSMTQTFDFSNHSLSDIQNKLDKETAILEFFLSKEKLAVFLITKSEFTIQIQDRNSNFIQDLTTSLKDVQNALKESEQLIVILKELNPEVNKLVVIPDQELLALPFEALPFNEKTFLIEQFDISYEYSMDFWLNKGNQSSSENTLMALASNYKTASFKALEENKFFNPDQINLSSLNFAIEEIEYANQVFSGKTWMNQEATKYNFINNLNSAGVIHLGLHGLLNNDFPDQSGLVFHPKDGQEVEDFLLTSAEIYNLDINPAITILSACNSGAGKLNDGDGLRSIARSFIHAGSRSILMSLWEAPDVSTNQIIQGFYNNLEEGKTMSKALQDAKLNYIENAKPSFKHPKYWAHLVLVGNAPPLGSDNKILYYLLPVLILVIGLFYFKRRS